MGTRLVLGKRVKSTGSLTGPGLLTEAFAQRSLLEEVKLLEEKP